MSKDNISVSELLSMSKKNPENMVSEVESRLSDEKKSELSRLLSDREALEKLIKSEKAQQLFRQLSGNK